MCSLCILGYYFVVLGLLDYCGFRVRCLRLDSGLLVGLEVFCNFDFWCSFDCQFAGIMF